VVPFNVKPTGGGSGLRFSQPFRLIIRSGKRATSFDKKRRLMTVTLPPGEEALVILGSKVDPACAKFFAGLSWAANYEDLFGNRASLSITSAEAFSDHALATWLVAPTRLIRFVNAIAKPKKPPTFKSLQLKPRNFGTRVAELSDTQGSIHRLSTSKVDVYATWREVEDNPLESGPTYTTKTAHAFEYSVERPDLTIAPAPDTHEIVSVVGSHQFEDTNYRAVRYHMLAMTQFAEYLADDIKKDLSKITNKGPAFQNIDVANTAPPAGVEIAFLVPIFGWQRKNGDGFAETRHERQSGGIRIYLKRPWYSSGDGEKLAVLFAPAPVGPGVIASADEVYRSFSAWGTDPIWLSGSIKTALAPENLSGGLISKGVDLLVSDNNLSSGPAPVLKTFESPPIGSKVTVDLVSYPVAVDERTRLAYVDVEVDAPTAYFPFVRFSLARYQPNSVNLAHLSRPILADCIQITPKRVLTITYPDLQVPGVGKRRHLHIVVAGPGPGSKDGRTPPNKISVAVEEFSESSGGIGSWTRPRPDPLTLDPEFTDAGWLWKASVPIEYAPGRGRRRLIVSEFEHLLSDDPRDDRVDPTRTQPCERLVYHDTVEIPSIRFI
jgi:hypothetical protein